MRETNPIQNDARRTTRQAKLGPDACCVLCGERQWEALIPVRRSLLEAHHIVGKANDAAFTEAVCRNCHAVMTETLRQCGTSMDKPATILDKIVAMLRAAGAFLVRLGEKLLEWADRLVRLILGLDRAYPAWRELPEAAP